LPEDDEPAQMRGRRRLILEIALTAPAKEIKPQARPSPYIGESGTPPRVEQARASDFLVSHVAADLVDTG
jgi:hypothetical protein